MCKNIFYIILFLASAGCYTVSGLKAIYPEVVKSHSGGAFFEVDSLQPTFRWESFPRAQDLRKDQNGLVGRIRNVTYELRIWQAQAGKPAKPMYYHHRFPEPLPIYSRQRIPEPLHKIEEPLEPSTNYIWSVRARFEVDGGTRVTEWAGIWLDQAARRSSVVPSHPLYYRFKTPPE